MSRYAPSNTTMSFGPGAMTPAVRAIILVNVVVFAIVLFASQTPIELFALVPRAVLQGQIWRPVTYLFLHDPHGLSHILFNMLLVWMFGVELERRWGTRGFLTYYLVTGVGAAICTMLASLLPFDAFRSIYFAPTIGASGAVYGLIMAWAIVFPTRTVLFMMMFPMTTRVMAMIMGAIAFVMAIGSSNSDIANITHLGGMLFGWLYLSGPKNMRLELSYRLTKWRMDRMRRKFNIHDGGRGRWDKNVH